MTTHCDTQRIVVVLALGLISLGAGAQPVAKKAPPSKDSVVIVASDRYGAGAFHRKMLGDNWRDVWATPIKVPVLDLKTFAGG
ncbi:MAG: hypothetical protein ACREOG_18885, partial [Gemmatimonadaceae bacterium]